MQQKKYGKLKNENKELKKQRETQNEEIETLQKENKMSKNDENEKNAYCETMITNEMLEAKQEQMDSLTNKIKNFIQENSPYN